MRNVERPEKSPLDRCKNILRGTLVEPFYGQWLASFFTSMMMKFFWMTKKKALTIGGPAKESQEPPINVIGQGQKAM